MSKIVRLPIDNSLPVVKDGRRFPSWWERVLHGVICRGFCDGNDLQYVNDCWGICMNEKKFEEGAVLRLAMILDAFESLDGRAYSHMSGELCSAAETARAWLNRKGQPNCPDALIKFPKLF